MDLSVLWSGSLSGPISAFLLHASLTSPHPTPPTARCCGQSFLSFLLRLAAGFLSWIESDVNHSQIFHCISSVTQKVLNYAMN